MEQGDRDRDAVPAILKSGEIVGHVMFGHARIIHVACELSGTLLSTVELRMS